MDDKTINIKTDGEGDECCSFCGISRDERECLIKTASSVCICEVCVVDCLQLLIDKQVENPTIKALCEIVEYLKERNRENSVLEKEKS